MLAASALSLAVLAAPASPALAAPHGTASKAAHVAGDFDGDGRPDLAIGAPGGNRVMVRYTHASPGGAHVALLQPNASSFHTPQRFGQALAVGDFNGDGFADLAVGAPRYTTKPAPGDVIETRGAIYVFHGTSHGLVADPLQLIGPTTGGDPFELGQALAAADTNGDGRADLAATVFGVDTGNIRLYSGTSTGLHFTFRELDDVEATSLAFGDVNGDHHPDLVAGSTVDLANPSDEFFGDIMTWPGTAGGLGTTPQKIRGDQAGAFRMFGNAVAIGDVNGDGFADVVVGAAYDRLVPSHPSGGTVVLLTGGPSGLAASRHQVLHEKQLFAQWHDGDGFGSSLAVIRVDGDRFADVVVGAAHERVSGRRQAGAVFLVHGGSSGLRVHHSQRITQATSGIPGSVARRAHFGNAVWASFLDPDRFGDAVVGVPDAAASARGGGFAQIPGSTGGLHTPGATGTFSHHAGWLLGTSVR